MPEPRIVTPEEAQRVEKALLTSPYSRSGIDAALLHTVATAPEREEARTRAAVVKALRAVIDLARASGRDPWSAEAVLGAVENGAPL